MENNDTESFNFQIGAAVTSRPDINIEYDKDHNYYTGNYIMENTLKNSSPYKYAEDRILSDLHDYVDNTYGEHYKTDDHNIECFDAWIALGDSTPTFRNTAIKYLWRYGKKNGSNKADLMKALHYTMMCLYVDHYKDDK